MNPQGPPPPAGTAKPPTQDGGVPETGAKAPDQSAKRSATAAPADHAGPPKQGGRGAAVVVTLIVLAILGLSVWYLMRPASLLIQGEADSTRIDIAARVDGRVQKIPVLRGQNVAAGAVLLQIDNPELLAKLDEAKASKGVADAELAHIHAGTRAETVAARKAAVDRAAADAALAQSTYERVRQVASKQYASQQQLDQATANLQVARRSLDQAQSSYQEALAGYTPEEVRMAEAKVVQAVAAMQTEQSLVDQLVVTAPAATQVYQINVEQGEVISPGVPLLSLVDLNDIWIRFDLREDLVRDLKVGDKIAVRIPALGDRKVLTEVRLIAAKGEYADWRATRATGDFDLRTFAIRAYPTESIAGLRPGMSAYADWPGAPQ
ncbi:MAG TPA: efflux RND transporter periplasmic adaptor subunit [Candidatus Acidoferrum sp.]|nr:efflux RND transporter periplasmic adaptor subunit [Candidatus Acidoferrum sp.]